MKSSMDIRRVLALVLGLVACGFLAIVETWYLLYTFMFVLALLLAGHLHKRWERRLLEALPLAWFLVLVVLGAPLFALLAQTMLVAMACRFVLTENARDYQGLVLIGVFITVLSAAGSISVTFGLLLLAQFLAATMLLIMAQFDGDVPLIARGFYGTMVACSLVSFIFAFGVFFALPRWTLGYIKGNPALVTQTTGFSKDVTISPGQVQQDATVVMRIEPREGEPPLRLPAYISGMRYTTFSGSQWLAAAGRPQPLYASSGIDTFVTSDEQASAWTTVYLEPTGTDVIFGLDHITEVTGQFQFLRRDAEGSLFTDAPYYKTIRYDVASLANDTIPVDDAVVHQPKLPDRYLQVPDLSPDFRAIAARVVRGATISQKAQATRDFLLANYTYSLDPTATSIEDFVVNHRTGYCEHFATSMVLLLRSQGVYARLVSGFVGTEWNNASGYLIVRASDAHTWVEVLDRDNWVRYDPTPGSFQQVSMITNVLDNIRMAWYRNVITYNLASQLQAVTTASRFMTASSRAMADLFASFRIAARRLLRDWRVLAGLAGAIAVGFLLLHHRSVVRRNPLILALEGIAGEPRRPGETLLELIRRVAPSSDLEAVLWRVYEFLFSENQTAEEEEALLRLLHDVPHTRSGTRHPL